MLGKKVESEELYSQPDTVEVMKFLRFENELVELGRWICDSTIITSLYIDLLLVPAVCPTGLVNTNMFFTSFKRFWKYFCGDVPYKYDF